MYDSWLSKSSLIVTVSIVWASHVIAAELPLSATLRPVGASQAGPATVMFIVPVHEYEPLVIAALIVATCPSGVFSATEKLNALLEAVPPCAAIVPNVAFALFIVRYSSLVVSVTVVLPLVATPPILTSVIERSLVVPKLTFVGE